MMLQTLGGSRLVELMRLDQPRERTVERRSAGRTEASKALHGPSNKFTVDVGTPRPPPS